jgi:hypothetical protein
VREAEPKGSRTKSITIYKPTFINFAVTVPVKVKTVQVYARGPGGSIAGSDCLKPRVERSAIISEFQGSPRNGAQSSWHVVVGKERRSHKSKDEGDNSHLFSGQKWLLLLLVGGQARFKFRKDPSCTQVLIIRSRFQYGRPKVPAIPEMVFPRS